MATPKQQQDGRFFVNEGYTQAGSRAQPKLMLGRDEAHATIRAALIQKLWQYNVELCQEFDEPEVWDEVGLEIARKVAAGEKVVYLDIDAGDAPELATGVLAGWQDCVPGIRLRMKDEAAEEEGREVRRVEARKLRDIAAVLEDGGGAQQLHEAMKAYIEGIKAHKPYQTDGDISQWADAKIRQITFCQQHMPDIRLKDLDMQRIEEYLSILAARPFKRTPGGKETTTPISKRYAQATIKEFRKFIRWLHRCRDFDWEKPRDYEVVAIQIPDVVRASPIRVATYFPEELKTLWRYATPRERAIMVIALNTGSGMAEIAGLLMGEVFLYRRHLHAEALDLVSDDKDSWIMRIRGKTRVYSEWPLWRTTVRAVEWLIRHRPETQCDSLVVTPDGRPFTVKKQRNTRIANAWVRLRERILKDDEKFRELSFNKIRKTGGNWVRQKYGKEIADLYLSHGEPVGQDVIAAYTNPRFPALHAAVRDYGMFLQPVFDGMADPFPEHEKRGGANISLGTITQIVELAQAGNRPKLIAERLNLSTETVRRWIKRQSESKA